MSIKGESSRSLIFRIENVYNMSAQEGPMRLTLAVHPVSNARFGDATRLEGSTLIVDREGLRRHLLEDRRFQDMDVDIARPGEPCRIGVVFDILEPRAKEPGDGADFPGVLGPFAVAGQGTTHVLRGAAVTVVDPTQAPGIASKMLEMGGEAGEASPYGGLCHVVLVPRFLPDMPRHIVLNALRMASVKAAVYLARAGIGQTPAEEEVFDLEGPHAAGREGLPRIAYIGQIHGHQMVVEDDEHILYGSNTQGAVPVTLHPNEWLDGGVLCSYWVMRVETYFYQNNPIILELFRRHMAGELTFVGTVATIAASEEEDRNRNCMLAAHLAKWALDAEGVVLTKYGGGAPHVDMGETARLCEKLGMRTVVQVSDSSGDRRAESAMLFNYPEVDAIVYGGGGDIGWDVGPTERVIAGSPAVANALATMTRVQAQAQCGVTNQQGASRVRAAVY
jgi:glycine reductase